MFKAVIVDDEEDIRYLIRYLVEKSGQKVEIAGEAEDARGGIDLCKKIKPQILFADIRMPGMEGLEMIGRIRQILPEIQSIIISGYDYFSYAQEAMWKGAAAYLLKPLDEALLEQALMKVKGILEQKKREGMHWRRMESELKKLRSRGEAVFPADLQVKNEPIQKALCYIHDNYHRDITLEEVAGVVFMNSAYFSALFKREMGQSFVVYTNGLRMKEAGRLLSEGELRAVEISHLLGFRDVSYFNRVFKKHYGKSPSEYKEGENKVNPHAGAGTTIDISPSSTSLLK